MTRPRAGRALLAPLDRAAHPGAGSGVAPPTALRGPVFVAATCTLAVAAHVAGGGAVPDLVHVLLAGLVAALGWAPACDRPHGPLTAIARVGAVQAALHAVLTQTLHADGAVGAGTAAVHPHAAAVDPSMSGALPEPLMWVAHAVAAVLLALWLLRGERAAWAAVARAVLLLADPAAPQQTVPRTRSSIPSPTPRRYRRPALPAVGLRAPPSSA